EYGAVLFIYMNEHIVFLHLFISLMSSSFTYYSSNQVLHSFPTRRSSDLLPGQGAAGLGAALARQNQHIGRQLDADGGQVGGAARSEEHTSELQSRFDLVCRLLLAKKKATMK